MIKVEITKNIIDKVIPRLQEPRYVGHITNFGRAVGLTNEECLFDRFPNLKREKKENQSHKNNDATLLSFKVEIKSETRRVAPDMSGTPRSHEFSTENFSQNVDFYLVGHLEGFLGSDFKDKSELDIVNSLLGKNIHVVGMLSSKQFNKLHKIQFGNSNFNSKTKRAVCSYSHLRDADQLLQCNNREEFKKEYANQNAKHNS